MKEINFIVKSIIKPILKDYSPVILIIKRNWANILGEKYFEFCEPEKIFFQKNTKGNATLYITAFNPVISFYIENNKFFILEKINSIFGYSIIKDIKIKQNPKIIKQYKKTNTTLNESDKTKITNEINLIEDSELKESLKELGQSLYSTKN